jgi:hypothetical protein
MSKLFEVELKEFPSGFFCIQPYYGEREFAFLIKDALPVPLHAPYLAIYREFREQKSGTIVCDAHPWVIVVFGSDPLLIRRRTLHEIVPLAKALYTDTGMRARFIERVYTETKIPG